MHHDRKAAGNLFLQITTAPAYDLIDLKIRPPNNKLFEFNHLLLR